MQRHTIYANLSETVTLVCEQCRRSKALDAAVVKDLPQPLKVRCPCGATFGVNIIIRQFYRKRLGCWARMSNMIPRRTKFWSRAG